MKLCEFTNAGNKEAVFVNPNAVIAIYVTTLGGNTVTRLHTTDSQYPIHVPDDLKSAVAKINDALAD